MSGELRQKLADAKDLIVSYSVLLGYEKEKGGCLGSCSHPSLEKYGNKTSRVRVEWCEVCEKDIYNSKMLLHAHNLLKDPLLTKADMQMNIKFLARYIKDQDIIKKVGRVPKRMATPRAPDIRKVLEEDERVPDRSKDKTRAPSKVKVYKTTSSNKKKKKIERERDAEVNRMNPSVENYKMLKKEGKRELDIAGIFGMHNAEYYDWKREVGLMKKRNASNKKSAAPKEEVELMQHEQTEEEVKSIQQEMNGGDRESVVTYEENINVEGTTVGELLSSDSRMLGEGDNKKMYCIDLQDEELVGVIKEYYQEKAQTLIQSSDVDDLRTASDNLNKLAQLLEVYRGE